MQILKATDDLVINGMAYPDFPILVDQDLELVMPANKFLIYTLLHRGRVSRRGIGNSKEKNTTWDSYAQSIYDYFSFLEARDTDWRDIHQIDGHTIVAAYRDWSIGECKLSDNTVNLRLGLIVRFYLYAESKGWINSLPFNFESVRISKPQGFLAHTDRSGGVVQSADVMLRRKQTLLQLYTKDQAKIILQGISNLTHLNIVRMLFKVGLRKAEVLTFPRKYLISPSQSKEYSSTIRVNLDPKDMITKGGVARAVDIPRKLMHQLWDYLIHERNQILVEAGVDDAGPETLFVNKSGEPFSVSSKSLPKNINEQISDTGIKFKFHKCRHTYATMTLYERQKAGDTYPLGYVKDRLGHASINTTEKYLHYIEMIEDQLMDAYQQELDDL